MSEQIKKAIKLIEEIERLQSKGIIDLTWLEEDEDEFSHQGLCNLSYDLHQLLQSELDRQENRALTLSELKEMIGEPVWVECEEPHWIIIEKIHLAENCSNVLATNNTWYTDIEIRFDVFCQFEGVDNCTFYKHKPTTIK